MGFANFDKHNFGFYFCALKRKMNAANKAKAKGKWVSVVDGGRVGEGKGYSECVNEIYVN